MIKEVYKEKRDELINKSQGFLDSGELENAEKIMADI